MGKQKRFVYYFTLLTMNLFQKPNVEIALFFRLQNNDDILFSLTQLNTEHQWGKHSMWEFQRKVVLNQVQSFICDCSGSFSFQFIFLNYIKLFSPYQDRTSLSTIWNKKGRLVFYDSRAYIHKYVKNLRKGISFWNLKLKMHKDAGKMLAGFLCICTD